MLSIGISAALSAPMTAGDAQTGYVPTSAWMPHVGDQFVVDVSSNMGYLIHTDASFTTFPVVSGQRRTVYYIGRSYFAATPEREWTVESLDFKRDDRVTFGPTGRFFRLYRDGESSPYGIHGHRDADEMIASTMRYRSMGCIIVSEPMLDIIERTFQINGGSLHVQTTARIPETVFSSAIAKD